MRDRSVLGLLSVVIVCAVGCGDNGATPYVGADSYAGAGGGAAQSTYCNAYCGSIVANGANCKTYNSDGHCGNACEWYRNTVCKNEYSAFANCLQTSTLSCYPTGNTWGLTFSATACGTAYDAFKKCALDNNVGVCPYGSF